MRFLFYIFFSCCFCFVIFLLEVKSQNKDSIKTYESEEVIVSATRSEIKINSSASVVTLLNSSQLEKINGEKLSDKVLSIPGLVIKDYGPGMLNTISIRGLGAEHTLILYNGVKLNDCQSGSFNLNNLLVDDIDRIEVMRGGNSALFGSDAVGGIINIIPKNQFDDLSIKCNLITGSFDYQKIFLNVHGKFNNFSCQASIGSEKSRNDYKYKFNDGSDVYEGNRKNSDFKNIQYNINMLYNLSEDIEFTLLQKYFVSYIGVPDIVLALNPLSRQNEKDYLSFINMKIKANNTLEINARLSYRYASLDYTDPKYNTEQSIYISNFKSNQYSIGMDFKYIFSKFIIFTSGIESIFLEGISNNYEGNKFNNHYAGFISAEIDLSNTIPFSIYPAVRYDQYSDFGSHFTPKIGINYKIHNDLLIFKSSISKNFRIPSFNDLYWEQGGNENLRPEYSTGIDFGLLSNFYLIGKNKIEVSFFNIQLKDRIIWMPLSGTIWSPKNLKEVESRGIECSFSSSFLNNIFNFGFNYNYVITKNVTPNDNNSGKYLPYIPKHCFNASMGFNYSPISANLIAYYFGEKYSTESNDRYSKIKDYANVNGQIMYSLSVYNLNFDIKLEINNIFNSEYVVVPYYPTSLRDYKLTMSIKY